MENLTRDSILQAMKKIDENPELTKGRESVMYDLVQKGKKYPPILVLSEASKILGGEELTIRDYNNSTQKAFKILRDLGFVVVQKDDNQINIWFVCQGSTYTNEKGKKYLWAPKLDKDGKRRFYWENMKRVKQGDIIFHYSKGVRGVSVAENECYDSKNNDENSIWGKDGYRIDIKHFEFKNIIRIDKLKDRRHDFDIALENVVNKPFNSIGGVNQGYLFEFSSEAGKLIYEIYGRTTGNSLIDDFFAQINNIGSIGSIAPERSRLTLDLTAFFETLKISNLKFGKKLLKQFVSSLLTKPFLILSGLSGSGKTKLAQAFVQWICGEEEQYKIVPVGADWTNREPLLGYANALDQTQYIKPDNGVVDLILHARDYEHLPHFLILDEMNLSHVERYFADFLSVMESNGKISFHSGDDDKSGVPASVPMPSNLFIIGTINVDETTYMFSPKVLDRANVIEFRISEKEITEFLENPSKPDLDQLKGEGAEMAQSFMQMAQTIVFENPANGELNDTLIKFFSELKKTGAEFGYRSAYEIHRLINQLTVIDPQLKDEEKLDIAIMQKLLPKLHGSRRKLCPVLVTLGGFCVQEDLIKDVEKEVFEKEEFDFEAEGVKYPLSLEKITRMHKGAVDNGFASYAEA
jgi:5-methylcytosine-specific restriction protein B